MLGFVLLPLPTPAQPQPEREPLSAVPSVTFQTESINSKNVSIVRGAPRSPLNQTQVVSSTQ